MTKYYLYIDECGDQNLANFDLNFPIFTLCGVLVSDVSKQTDVELHSVVEMRGKKEDSSLRSFYAQLLDRGTYWIRPERLRQYAKSFTFLPKRANVIGLQVADLIAYPITRHLLNPNEPNMAYEIIKDNIYTVNNKQIGIKLLPAMDIKKDCQN